MCSYNIAFELKCNFLAISTEWNIISFVPYCSLEVWDSPKTALYDIPAVTYIWVYDVSKPYDMYQVTNFNIGLPFNIYLDTQYIKELLYFRAFVVFSLFTIWVAYIILIVAQKAVVFIRLSSNNWIQICHLSSIDLY